MRFFNTAGPANCNDHYCLDPLVRINLNEILSLIEQKKYFVLHAPRQTGKTTSLLSLMEYLNNHGKYISLYFNVETAQAARENVKEAMKAILHSLTYNAFNALNDSFLKERWLQILNESGEFSAFEQALTLWSEQSPKPIVLLIDEIDSLIGDTLISVLRQLRAGYIKRPRLFPQSIILCGVRDVRDYRIHSDKEKTIITGGSAFNIKAESLRMGNFSKDEIYKLYYCHTEETGQKFDTGAIELVWDFTQGQPWLVNALGYEVCFKIKEGKNRSQSIIPEMIIQAKENLILRRETHLDQLSDKLSEKRIQSVIEPIVYGTTGPYEVPEDDIQYASDLGIISLEGGIHISNPIYAEIIPRQLTFSAQQTISHQPFWYITPEGFLDMDKLLKAFQEFFREHSEHWIERFQYKEAGPQLLLQAFLQRIVNSGGRIEREYGLGRGRTDLMVIWEKKGAKEIQKIVIELKILHKSLERTIKEGLKQTSEYMDKCGTNEGNLVVFDRSPDKKWEDKIFYKEEESEGKKIKVWGM